MTDEQVSQALIACLDRVQADAMAGLASYADALAGTVPTAEQTSQGVCGCIAGIQEKFAAGFPAALIALTGEIGIVLR